MPRVMASSWSMTLLLSISPANRLTAGKVAVVPPVIVAEPCALRNPLAVATTVYVPETALRLKVPSGLAGMDATNVPLASYNLTITGSVARTCPVRVPIRGGVGVSVGVLVGVSVGMFVGVSVGVLVGVYVGVLVGVGVSVEVGVGVCEAVGVIISPPIVKAAGPVEGSGMRLPSPFETRAVHSTEVCPTWRAMTLKVKAAPLAVALWPLLPAIATIKVPFCGSLIAPAASVPKRLPIVILLAVSRLLS